MLSILYLLVKVDFYFWDYYLYLQLSILFVNN